MAHPSAIGGTALAPTPTHPHHLSRETSRDELDMADSLRLLNQAHEHQKPSVETPSQEPQPIHAPDDQTSEIYHSLEDAVPIADAPPAPSPSASLQMPNMAYEPPNAPVTGQVCRYVICFCLKSFCLTCHRLCDDSAKHMCEQSANRPKQL